jgi:DNA-binding FadR family transcriptional regulator
MPARVHLPGPHVRARKTGELVAGDLRDRILRGELHEGDALPQESELMARYGVSRPTLREALRILESESLVTIRPGARGGPRITLPDVGLAGRYVGLLLQLSGTTIGDLFVARTIIEPQLVRLLAEQPDRGEAVALLRAILEEERQLVDDPIRFNAAATRFHRTLIDQAGNQTLAVLAGSVWHLIEHHTSSAANRNSGRVAHYDVEALANHERLVDLVEVGASDDAERLWKRHMEGFRALMLRFEGGDHPIDVAGLTLNPSSSPGGGRGESPPRPTSPG